jgi:transcriptional regulator with XRE-family HTH domain
MRKRNTVGARGTPAERLSQIVRSQGLSQADLAADLGTTTATVSRILSGKQGLTLATAEKLAARMEVRAAWLLTGELPVRPDQSRSEAGEAAYMAGWHAAVTAMGQRLNELIESPEAAGTTSPGSPSSLGAAKRHRRELEARGLAHPPAAQPKRRKKRA